MAPAGELVGPATDAPVDAPAASRVDVGSTWGEITVLSLLAALLSLPGVQLLHDRFPVENLSVEMTNRIRNNRDDPVAWAQERTNRWTSLARTAASCLAVFGAIFLGLVGLSIGWRQGSALGALRLGLTGGFIGAIGGVLGGLLESTLNIRLEKAGLDPLLLTALGHSAAWGSLATAMALLLRRRVGTWRSLMIRMGRGCGAAGLASLVYAVVAAICFQLLRSDLPIPEGLGNQFVFLLIGGWALGAGLLRPLASNAGESALVPSAEVLVAEGAGTI